MKTTRKKVLRKGWLSRERALAIMLIVATAIVMYLCYRLILPFLPALAWALAAAVIAHPLHLWIGRFVPYRNIAAGFSVLVVTFLIIAPVVFVTDQIVREVGKLANTAQEQLASGKWRSKAEQYPRFMPVVSWVERQVGISTVPEVQETRRLDDADRNREDDSGKESEFESETDSPEPVEAKANTTARSPPEDSSPGAPVGQAASMITQGLESVVTGTIWLLMQLSITIMTLFFFFRDGHHALGVLRSLLPLSHSEANEVFRRVDDTIHATIYGSVVVGLVQGTMGGLIFWFLGLPSPLAWGVVMGLLALVPVLGTFVIWGPTALFLAIQGEWGRALVLVAWGGIAIGLIDNLLNPFLVGKRLRFHTLLVFFSILGGIALFGASGIILGPLILAVADALQSVWQRRTAYGGTVEAGVKPAG